MRTLILIIFFIQLSRPSLQFQNVSRPLSIATRCLAEGGQRGQRQQGDRKTERFKKEHEITEQDVQDSIEYMYSSGKRKTYTGQHHRCGLVWVGKRLGHHVTCSGNREQVVRHKCLILPVQ